MDLPQRKSVNDVLAEYMRALSVKKRMILALAATQVSCEECEAELLEAYSAVDLKRIHGVRCDTADPKSATGRYFNAVSSIRFDPLET